MEKLSPSASEMQRLSTASRKRNALERKLAQTIPPMPTPNVPEAPVDLVAEKNAALAATALTLQAETLQDYSRSRDAQERQRLASALVSLRDFFHMVTGAPRPGVLKEGRKRVTVPSQNAILGPTRA